jgi:hypothetical protein
MRDRPVRSMRVSHAVLDSSCQQLAKSFERDIRCMDVSACTWQCSRYARVSAIARTNREQNTSFLSSLLGSECSSRLGAPEQAVHSALARMTRWCLSNRHAQPGRRLRGRATVHVGDDRMLPCVTIACSRYLTALWLLCHECYTTFGERKPSARPDGHTHAEQSIVLLTSSMCACMQPQQCVMTPHSFCAGCRCICRILLGA